MCGLHLVASLVFGVALGGYWLLLWLTLTLQCNIIQTSFTGCDACACAVDNTCTFAQLNEVPCKGCNAPSAAVCGAVNKTLIQYLLAFSGPAILISTCIAASYGFLALRRWELRRSALEAKKQAAGLAVDQQTRLVIAGDKPTITPGTLSDLVSFLLDSGEKRCIMVADKCRRALLERGFDLPVRKGLPSLKNAASKRMRLASKPPLGFTRTEITVSASTSPVSPNGLRSQFQGRLSKGMAEEV